MYQRSDFYLTTKATDPTPMLHDSFKSSVAKFHLTEFTISEQNAAIRFERRESPICLISGWPAVAKLEMNTVGLS
jgi:hypothetical protein